MTEGKECRKKIALSSRTIFALPVMPELLPYTIGELGSMLYCYAGNHGLISRHTIFAGIQLQFPLRFIGSS